MAGAEHSAVFPAASCLLAITPGPGIFYAAARTFAGGGAEGVASSNGTRPGRVPEGTSPACDTFLRLYDQQDRPCDEIDLVARAQPTEVERKVANLTTLDHELRHITGPRRRRTVAERRFIEAMSRLRAKGTGSSKPAPTTLSAPAPV